MQSYAIQNHRETPYGDLIDQIIQLRLCSMAHVFSNDSWFSLDDESKDMNQYFLEVKIGRFSPTKETFLLLDGIYFLI